MKNSIWHQGEKALVPLQQQQQNGQAPVPSRAWAGAADAAADGRPGACPCHNAEHREAALQLSTVPAGLAHGRSTVGPTVPGSAVHLLEDSRAQH